MLTAEPPSPTDGDVTAVIPQGPLALLPTSYLQFSRFPPQDGKSAQRAASQDNNRAAERGRDYATLGASDVALKVRECQASAGDRL